MDRKSKLDSLFEAFSIVSGGSYVYVCDMKQDLSRCSKSAVEYFGLPSEYMKNVQGIWSEHLHPQDRDYFNESIDAIFRGTDSNHMLEYRAKRLDGEYVVCVCQGVVILGDDGSQEYFCGTIRNHDSVNYVDDVTNLRSLYGFLDDVKAALGKNKEFDILMIGVEEFSRTNDIFGYIFGNRALRKLGSVLMDLFRRDGSVYRVDGTKFAIIASHTSMEHLKELYKELQEICAKEFYVGSERLTLSLCAGALHLDRFSVSPNIVYSFLKYATHESKMNCHGEPFVFQDILSDESRDNFTRLNVIRSSIVDECAGFELFYQPVVDASTEKLCGAEALIRWRNKDYGLVPPFLFVPVLEQDSLFPELGKWILREAMMSGNRIRAKYPDFIMNVNLSYAQLERMDFVDMVMELLNVTQFPAKNLCLELTERCRLLDMKMLKAIFEKLRGIGVKIALDDFGTGFSSIGVLRKLPIDCVKIDRDYVLNVQSNEDDQNTVKFIAELAEAFGAELCVEGVETVEMRDILRRYNVTTFQGFFYSRPVPLEDFCKKYAC